MKRTLIVLLSSLALGLTLGLGSSLVAPSEAQCHSGCMGRPCQGGASCPGGCVCAGSGFNKRCVG